MAVSRSPVLSGSARTSVTYGGREDGRVVIWLRGEHDVSTVAEIADSVAFAIALDDADLVLDLSQVEFMDAATVGVIIRAQRFLRPRSRALELRSPSPCARRVLALCGLTAETDVKSEPRERRLADNRQGWRASVVSGS